ncbi:M16 family metallopeptidase [Sphingomonas quercus]|uniref:Insulinase family protein n=1 Tax=Sphingomonas quercus TaxID=2842451 RepID=A0ABS6BDR1_9SPHN|nr:insulinase family protein [Sphingomonas quercus]MBU3076458.1 insulinase family protein [Sphingomonas quercus]
MALLVRLLALLLVLNIPLPAIAQPGGWLYEGSDTPPDPAWQLGSFDNGMRYAIRRNALPAGSVSVRLRIDAGALMEQPDQKGYAHFIEHMLFRGAEGVPDGEGIRIWQRLGASFGSDTNAFTTLTQTFYALDLPRNDSASLDIAFGALSGMMRSATIDPKLVDVERKVVMAERDARMPPLVRRSQEAARSVFYAGLRAQQAELAGTDETLGAATAGRLRDFYERWYRPERATIIIAGDADPEMLRALAEKWFAGWRGKGDAPADPDFGTPTQPDPATAIVIDRQASNTMTFLWPRPHDDRPWSQERQANEFVRQIAARIISRRMTQAARGGAAFTSASVSATMARHLMDQTTIAVAHRQTMWQPAMQRAFAVLAEGSAGLPSRAEIDREIAVQEDSLAQQISARPTMLSPVMAGMMLGAVDAGMTLTTPEAMRDMFEAVKPTLTPAVVGTALRALTVGEPRALFTAPVPIQGGEQAFAAALAKAREAKAEARVEAKAVSFADLGKPPVPGRIVSRSEIPDLGVTRVRFANGVELVVKQTDFEKDRVLVAATVGYGIAGMPPDRYVPLWTARALTQGGIGPLDVDAIERLLAGRRISLSFGVDENGFDYAGATNARDLADTLRLAAAGVAEPRFDAGAFGRLKGQLGGTYDAIFSTPGGVFGTFAPQALHGGDARWFYPGKSEILTLGMDSYRNLWTPLLAYGPRRLLIVGDVDVQAAIDATAATIGAAVTRPAPEPDRAQLNVRPPKRGSRPLLLKHRGDPAQALVALVWSTDGALRDVPTVRALNVAASIFRTRLFDRFRETEGGSYSPSVGSNQSQVFPRYGVFIATAQVRADRVADFERVARDIAKDLAKAGPNDDEVTRAVAPVVSANQRNSRTNGYWLGVLDRDLDDPRVLDQIRSAISGYQAVDAEAVRKAARKWLSRAPSLRIVVDSDARAAAKAD